MLKEQSRALEDIRVAIQGAGNVGAHLARLLAEEGVKVIAISDSRGGVFKADGLDIPAALAFKGETGSFEGFRGA